MTLPSFIIIGAQKSGTTSLYNYMIEHPQILPSSMKELHFFNWRSKPGRKGNKKVKWYLKQFPETADGKNILTGEATPDYLIDPYTPQRMFELWPNFKLIVLLRNPVDRAISHYYHNLAISKRAVNKKREPLSFKKAIEKEIERLKLEKEKLINDQNYRSLNHRQYSYLERGIYVEQLEKWMSVFPREQFLILKSEEFFQHPNLIVNQVFDFLGLPNHQITNNRKYNQRSYQPIEPEIRTTLAKYFKPYNQRLEEFLGMKFDWEKNADTLKQNEPKKPKINSSKTQIKETPLLTQEAIEFLADLLEKKPDAKVLEFGSGGSTIWFSQRTKNLTSIEHTAKWHKIVKNNLKKNNSCNQVNFKLLSRPYHTICEEFPDNFFDIIIVDGRDRVKCVEASIRVLKPGGILMLNDAQTDKYKSVPKLLNNWNLQQTVSTSRPRHTYWWEKPLSVTPKVSKPVEASSPLIIVTSASEKPISPRPYVFAIGLNKCGTTSLGIAFKELGWSSLHGPYKFNQAIARALKKGKKMLHFLPGFNMFCDIFYPINLEHLDEHSCIILSNRQKFFEIIEKQYPGTKFICNIRNKKDWLSSRKRHVQRNQNNPDNCKLKWFKIEEDAWSEEYDQHYNIVFDYFKDRENLLVMDFDQTLTYESLCQFLQVPIPQEEFPRRNVSQKQKV